MCLAESEGFHHIHHIVPARDADELKAAVRSQTAEEALPGRSKPSASCAER